MITARSTPEFLVVDPVVATFVTVPMGRAVSGCTTPSVGMSISTPGLVASELCAGLKAAGLKM